jgi:calcineurin-like phosphoesterase family protein
MSTWFTADLHLGHANIIRYCDRPFADVDAMNQALIERWNDVVDAGDEVWVLGDVALGTIVETLPRVRELRGTKFLLTGNHDRCWDGHGHRADGWTERYFDAGFAAVRHGQVELDVGDNTVLACHFPYRGDTLPHDRFLERRPIDEGRWLLHGHVHERWRQRGRMINVGTDARDFRPVSEAEIIELIAAGPRDRPTD